MRKVSPWPQHAIMLRRTSMGLNNSLIFLHYFMLLWAICCLLSHGPRHNGLFWNKEEINCLLMPRCVPFSYVKLLVFPYDDVMIWRMFSDTNVKFFSKQKTNVKASVVRQDTINDIVCDAAWIGGRRRNSNE